MSNFNNGENKIDFVQGDKYVLVPYCTLPVNSVLNNIELKNSCATDK